MVRVLGFLVVALMTLAVGGFGYLYLRKPAMVPPAHVRVESTPARLARGRYLYNLADCDGCHSLRDYSRFDGPVVESGRGRGTVFPPDLGLPGVVAARNITPDKETGIGNWTDGEKIRAIREGISRDGTALFPMMGYERFRHMSDEDVYSLVAYLNTLTPIQNPLPRSKIIFPVSMLMKGAPQPAGQVPEPDRSSKVKYGEYLVAMAGCMECHTPAKQGKPVQGLTLAGGQEFRFPGAVVVSANITPDPQTGIGRWSEQYFLDHFYQYKDYAEKGAPLVGPESFTVMPWLNFARLEPEDLKAIYAFLRTQQPVYHVVDSHPVWTSRLSPRSKATKAPASSVIACNRKFPLLSDLQAGSRLRGDEPCGIP
ncbi:MAG TPA: c-type cytochrome [Candidatus Acidoferrales bacterium]|nr:c-type cytochrome [Candidatus Acidoferrales bacterium]